MITVKSVSGPSPDFIYLEGVADDCPQATRRRSIACAALADGRVTIADEKAALIAEVTQARTNWLAAQQALADL